MNKCIKCNNEYESKRSTSKYCSAQCRKLAFQNKEDSVPMDAKISVPAFSVLDAKFCGKQAVKYDNDKFESRPHPNDVLDVPDPDNRNIFKRPDGTEYVVDAVGKTIEWK